MGSSAAKPPLWFGAFVGGFIFYCSPDPEQKRAVAEQIVKVMMNPTVRDLQPQATEGGDFTIWRLFLTSAALEDPRVIEELMGRIVGFYPDFEPTLIAGSEKVEPERWLNIVRGQIVT